MSVIYLVRHGQGSFGTDNYDKLSELGREQARLVGEHFATAGERLDRVYSGSLTRQLESAELLLAGLGADAAVRLGEVCVEPAFDEYAGDALLKAFTASLAAAELEAVGWPAIRHDRKRFQFLLERAARAWVDAELAAGAMLPWASFHGRII